MKLFYIFNANIWKKKNQSQQISAKKSYNFGMNFFLNQQKPAIFY